MPSGWRSARTAPAQQAGLRSAPGAGPGRRCGDMAPRCYSWCCGLDALRRRGCDLGAAFLRGADRLRRDRPDPAARWCAPCTPRASAPRCTTSPVGTRQLPTRTSTAAAPCPAPTFYASWACHRRCSRHAGRRCRARVGPAALREVLARLPYQGSHAATARRRTGAMPRPSSPHRRQLADHELAAAGQDGGEGQARGVRRAKSSQAAELPPPACGRSRPCRSAP